MEKANQPIYLVLLAGDLKVDKKNVYIKTKEMTSLTNSTRDCWVQTGIHSNFLLASLEVRSQSADHRSAVLLELPPQGDLGEILELQIKKEKSFKYQTKWVYLDSKRHV